MHVLSQVKSQIIRVVQVYFMKIINKQKLWVVAYIVNVTLLINGANDPFFIEIVNWYTQFQYKKT